MRRCFAALAGLVLKATYLALAQLLHRLLREHPLDPLAFAHAAAGIAMISSYSRERAGIG